MTALQVPSCQTFFKINFKLGMDLSPVLPVTGLFFRDIHGCQIQHFQETVIGRKYRLAFGHFFHPAYRKRSDGMCRFLCSASAYQPPTVGEQYFRGRNSDRKGAKSHAVSECASKNSFYICIVIPTRKDSSPGTRSRSPPWLSMIFRTEESPIP